MDALEIFLIRILPYYVKFALITFFIKASTIVSVLLMFTTFVPKTKKY